MWSRDGSVGTTTGYGLDGPGTIPGRAGFFSSPQSPNRLWSSPSHPGVKWPGHEADHSSPSSAEVKNGGAVPPLPICLHGIVLN
jgi:hypothetical protein